MLPFLRNRAGLLRWLLSALAETAVAVPWMMLVYSAESGSTWPEALPGAWLLLLVYLAGGFWEAGDKKDDPRRRIYALLAGTAIAYLLAYQALPTEMRSGLLAWNRAVYFVPVAAYLWYQGARGAIEGIEYGRIFSRFTMQFGAQLGGILLLMMAGSAGNPRVQLLLYWSVILLFAAGLSLLLVTRERSLKADQARMGEKGASNGVTPVMTAVVVGLTLLTLAASRLLSVERLLALMSTVGNFVSPFFNWLWQVAFLILSRWLTLLSPLFSWLRNNRLPEQAIEAPEGDDTLGEPEMDWGEAGPGFDITPYMKAALLIIALLVLISWLYRLNRSRRESLEDDEERISLGFWRSLWADLKALLGLAGRKAAPALEAARQAVMGDDRQDPRALFRRLQAWGTSRGRPRNEAETPNRYREALSEHRPEAEQPAGAVTAVYNQARYGRTAPADEAVAEASEALKNLEKPAKPSA